MNTTLFLKMFESRWYQTEGVDAPFEYFLKGGKGHPVIVMPGGTGKSVVIALTVERLLKTWPHLKIMMLTHVKELIEQNAEKLKSVWHTAPLGIHSEGLGQRETALQIIYGGVQSVYQTIKKAQANGEEQPFGKVDIVLIDECHLLGQNESSMYQKIINALTKENENLKLFGYTATPYRMGQGCITDDGLFTDICYDIADYKNFNRLIDEGFIMPLVVPRTKTKIDLEGVKIQGWDYNKKQLSDATEKVIFEACKELVYYGQQRKKWMIFCSSIKNAELTNEILNSFGVNSTVVHSKLKSATNDYRIKAYRHDEYTCMVNQGKLTTGFDCPQIDLIGVLRALLSVALWVQMLSRGTRPAPWAGKDNCLVLDFAGNSGRLGPINDPIPPRKKGKGTGDAPVKFCDQCDCMNHASARVCAICGAVFEFKVKIKESSYEHEVLKTEKPIIEYFDVSTITYSMIQKKRNGIVLSPPMMKVNYFCGLRVFSEIVCVEHDGYAQKKARDWWRVRHYEPLPMTTYDALKKKNELKKPIQIKVNLNKKYPEILGYSWE